MTNTNFSQSPCFMCKNNCCTYVNVTIDEPIDIEDFDYLAYQISHENVIAFFDGEDWVVSFRNTNCQYLNKDGSCGNYEKRYKICRTYTTDDCLNGLDEETVKTHRVLNFDGPKDLDEYCIKRFGDAWMNRFSEFEKELETEELEAELENDLNDLNEIEDEEPENEEDKLDNLELVLDDVIEELEEKEETIQDLIERVTKLENTINSLTFKNQI